MMTATFRCSAWSMRTAPPSLSRLSRCGSSAPLIPADVARLRRVTVFGAGRGAARAALWYQRGLPQPARRLSNSRHRGGLTSPPSSRPHPSPRVANRNTQAMIRTPPMPISKWSVRTAPPRVVGPGLLLKARCCPLAARLTYGPPGGGPFLSRPATLPGAYSADTLSPHMFAIGLCPAAQNRTSPRRAAAQPDGSALFCRAACSPKKTARPVRSAPPEGVHGFDVATLSQRGRGGRTVSDASPGGDITLRLISSESADVELRCHHPFGRQWQACGRVPRACATALPTAAAVGPGAGWPAAGPDDCRDRGQIHTKKSKNRANNVSGISSAM